MGHSEPEPEPQVQAPIQQGPTQDQYDGLASMNNALMVQNQQLLEYLNNQDPPEQTGGPVMIDPPAPSYEPEPEPEPQAPDHGGSGGGWDAGGWSGGAG